MDAARLLEEGFAPDFGVLDLNVEGASGLRMLYEMYLQLNGRAGERQRPDPVLGMTHNLGGFPSQNVSSITIVGRYGA